MLSERLVLYELNRVPNKLRYRVVKSALSAVVGDFSRKKSVLLDMSAHINNALHVRVVPSESLILPKDSLRKSFL